MAERSKAPDSSGTSLALRSVLNLEHSGTRMCAWVRIPLLTEFLFAFFPVPEAARRVECPVPSVLRAKWTNWRHFLRIGFHLMRLELIPLSKYKRNNCTDSMRVCVLCVYVCVFVSVCECLYVFHVCMCTCVFCVSDSCGKVSVFNV